MTKRRSFLIVLLGLVMALCLSFAVACGGGDGDKDKDGKNATLTWTIGEHAKVQVDGYDAPPESVAIGTELKFSVVLDNGYEAVVTVGRTRIEPKAGKYTYQVKGSTSFTVTTSKIVSGVTVAVKSDDGLTYYAGETLRADDIDVSVAYATGESEKVDKFRVIYEKENATAFSLGDTYFTVSYGSAVSDPVNLKTKVVGRIVIDPANGEIASAYAETLQANDELQAVATDPTTKAITFTFAEPLTKDITLPNAGQMSRGTNGDYTFTNWTMDDASVGKIPAELNVSATYTAHWKAYLLDLDKVTIAETEDNGVKGAKLVVEGKYRAATEGYLYFYEGKAKVEIKGSNFGGGSAKRGDAFTLEYDLKKLTERDYLDKWMDIKFVSESNGIKDVQEIALSEYSAKPDFYDKDNAVIANGYRYHFEESGGLLKICASVYVDVEYSISVAGNETDDLKFVFSGTVKNPEYYGKTAVVDFYIGSIKPYYGAIGADGKFTVTVPINDWGLNEIAYAHFSVVESEKDTTKLFPSSGEYNLPNANCTNTDFSTEYGSKAPDSNNGDLLRDGVLMVRNSDWTRVFYIGPGLWGGIIAYGYNERSIVNVVGDVALKVDNFETPTKVYYVVNLSVSGKVPYTEEQVRSFVLGNTNGTLFIYEQDPERSEKKDENTYRLWFDVTGHAGKSMLWSNLYLKTEKDGNDNYDEKILEVKDSDRSSNGLFAVVGGYKYTILCTNAGDDSATGDRKENTYNSANLIVEKAGEQDVNPPATDPDQVETKYSLTLDPINCEMKLQDGKPVLIIRGTLEGYTAQDLYFDLQENSGWTYTIFKNCAKVEPSGKFEITIDLTEVPAISGYYFMHIECKPVMQGDTWKKDGDKVVHEQGGMTQDVALPASFLPTLDQAIPGAGKEGGVVFQCSANQTSYSVVLHMPYNNGAAYATLEVKGAAASSLTANQDSVLEKDESAGKVYLTFTATVVNYTEADLKKLCVGDISNGVVKQLFPCAIATIQDGVATLKFDITNAAVVNELYLNLYDGNTGTAKKLADLHRSSNSASAVSLGTKYYRLTTHATYGSALLQVTDSAQPEVKISSVTLEADAEQTKAYYVVTVTVKGYTKDQIQANVSYGGSAGEYKVAKIEDADGGYKLYFDVTNAKSSAGGEWVWSHLFYETKGYDGSGGDIKTGGTANGTKITVGNKEYSIKNDSSTYSMDVLVVKDLSA